MKYIDQVKEDLKTWIQENDYMVSQDIDYHELMEDLYDKMWVCDYVTGNGSGSYTFNRNKAKEYVFADIQTVIEACIDFGCTLEDVGDHFINEDWEWFDVTARCFVLYEAIDTVLSEMLTEQ